MRAARRPLTPASAYAAVPMTTDASHVPRLNLCPASAPPAAPPRAAFAWVRRCRSAAPAEAASARSPAGPQTAAGHALWEPRAALLTPAREKRDYDHVLSPWSGLAGGPCEHVGDLLSLRPVPASPQKKRPMLRTVASAGKNGRGPSETGRLSWHPLKRRNMNEAKKQTSSAKRLRLRNATSF